MRPPSYYASIVKNNSSNSGAGHLYGSPDYDSARNPRTSSQQLRSSFSSPSSSSYVSRSHLPFAPHSTLVAHCFTGAGSSTRPYNSPSSSSSSPTSNHLLSRQNSRGSSYISSSSSLSSSYASNSAGSSVSSLNSRVPSTKRQPYSSSSSPSTAGLMRPSYLSPSVLTSSPTSRYRPVTASSYYKPIRLRERPLLTQLSRRLNSTSPTPRLTASDATSASSRSSGAVAAAAAAAADSLSRLKIDNAIEPETGAYEEQPANEASWSSDIGRNISRNKYLIKFREIDKSHPSTRPVVDVEATIELPTHEHEHEHRLTRIQSVPDREETPARDEAEMQLPKSQKPKEHQEPLDEGEAPCDKKIESSGGGQKVAAPSKKAPLKKEKKNVKLKVRAIGSKTSTNENEATTTTTIINKPAENKAEQPKEQVKAARAKDVAPALRKEEAKGALLPQPPAKADDEKKEEEAKAPAAKVKRVIKTSTEAKENKQLEPVAASETKASEPAPPTAAPTQREPARKEEALQPTQTKTKVVKIKKRPKTMDEQSPEGEQENATKTKTKLKLAAPKAGSKKMKEGPAADVSASKSEKGDQKMAPAGQKSTDKQTPARIRFREYNYNDFNFLTVLGHGGWGFVILAELKEHEACFAVKCIKKITIVEDDDYDSIMIERKVLTLGNIHPFICKLFCTFETPGYLFFVMEYCAGGDLMFHVQHEGKFAESRCRFYAAEIICAIRFLHNRHIIYRDLKLDNILLDERGHIRLVDFGMCQCRTYREELLPSNFCGTPEYISPEIIKGVPYNHSVDWWSFGVLLYEMAIGKMPFRGDDENELLWNVCYEQIHYPMFLSKELTSLLKLLLEREPTKRMGMATCKAGDIYEQPFFRGVDWKAVEELRVEPPFVPEVRSNRDVSNFDSDFTESTCELSPVDESTLAKIDQTQFQQFPYTNPDIFIFDSPRAAGPT